MTKKLTIIEKVAMTWTFPLMIVVFSFLSFIAIAAFLIVSFLNISGTIGACIYLFDQVKLLVIGRRLKKLVKKDEEMYKFGSDKTE
jgi:hypothetical protein